MKLVRLAWKLLVGVKDALVLLFMLLFFGTLFALLSARPNPATVSNGALVVALEGQLVEQPEESDPFASLAGGQMAKQTRLRDVIRALDLAKSDAKVKAVVLDMDSFTGGYPAVVAQAAEAVAAVRATGKPVLAYALGYTDAGYLIAANASEIWAHPLVGTAFMGPGGSQLYYKGLIDKLGVNAHIYRVGTYKSAVEPYLRADQSPEARAANEALYGAILSRWQELIAKARPKARVADFLSRPAEMIRAAGGDLSRANLAAGIVDQTGDKIAFGKRVAQIAGAPAGKPAGSFNTIKIADYLAANPLPTTGDAIGVVTVAGEIVDGEAGPGRAGGDTIARLVLKGLAEKKLKALVVRVDSPGGSVLASETIRQAILQAKAQGLPVIVSMSGLAASGGYWVSTPADMIFAEPNTITGSIGVFGVIPTFENALSKIGVTSDGVRTTPLSGQPDVFGGTSPEFDTILQSSIEDIYRRFVGVVAASRKLAPARVNEIGQGRVWDGGTARQIGLVDRFGSLDDAVAEAARRAKLDPAKVRTIYLEKEPSWAAQLAEAWQREQDRDKGTEEARMGGDLFARLAADRRGKLAQAAGDVRRLLSGQSVQARCLECAGFAPADPRGTDRALADLMLARVLP
ncbi:signal peptide peptidase SppA [Sphingomonas spermidinifaciens]|uniref:Signal peptide peptidase SppA n=1 Tax=Sphingomonas spermidinifaciens TaxID=1141889 RepID=A0A2A4B7G3_9SPHN|nr:signal peptide peptidase SppA [Sphingomonas spermidinifaciens]PCD03719.1 signal peptide peptidase SppA [Sphingomonas spermidinifaciens]